MPTLSQHVCFSCRKVFKKPHFYAPIHAKKEEIKWPAPYRCPECGHDMTYMGYKFRAPRLADVKEWKRIEEAMKLGTAWQTPTQRKAKPQPKISAALKKALGAPTTWKKEPNQSLEPTSVLGTSAAEQPLVPSTLVAHL